MSYHLESHAIVMMWSMVLLLVHEAFTCGQVLHNSELISEGIVKAIKVVANPKGTQHVDAKPEAAEQVVFQPST